MRTSGDKQKSILSTQNAPHLTRTLGPIMLWGLGVGYVISGNYFGWNLGLEKGGTLGMLLALIPVIIMYACFTFCYTEMACAIPKAGGAFDYGTRAYGQNFGLLAGIAQLVEFVFAPPAIALGLGAYLGGFFPGFYPDYFPVATAISAYILFTLLNITGVKMAASFELFVTAVAVIGLLIFAGNALPAFNPDNVNLKDLPFGWTGVAAAVPFAIWFFLAIEGVANVAEETINPQKNILRGFGAALFTLIVLCCLTFFSSVGANGWEAAVYKPGTTETSDSPLPMVFQSIGISPSWQTAILVFGLFGIVASLNGIILAAGRALFEMAKSGFAPTPLAALHKRFKSPHGALVANLMVGVSALLIGLVKKPVIVHLLGQEFTFQPGNITGDLITIACFGALALYFFSMLAFIKLRKSEPDMERPFRAPLYPIAPILAIVISFACFVAMAWFNPWQAVIFILFLGVFTLLTRIFKSSSNEKV